LRLDQGLALRVLTSSKRSQPLPPGVWFDHPPVFVLIVNWIEELTVSAYFSATVSGILQLISVQVVCCHDISSFF